MNVSNDTADLTLEMSIMVPSMCVTALIAFLGNCYIVASIPWIRRRSLNANLRWSLSLAAADAWAALLIVFGLLFNTFLPKVVWNYQKQSACFYVILEVFRLGGMITSVLHLLALSLNHYASIIYPFKHKLMMTSSRTKLITVVMWITPTVVLLICFGSVPGQGFQSKCMVNKFYNEVFFRALVLAFFSAPMLIMLVVYGKILRTLSSTIKDIHVEVIQSANHSEPITARNAHERNNLSPTNLVRITSLHGRTKAVTTTLLIVGTFAFGWLPSVVLFVIVCNNCLIIITDLQGDHAEKMFYLRTIVNCLIIVKLLINPLIYGFRILEIRYALWAMYARRCRRISKNSIPLPKRFQGLSAGSSGSSL